MSWYWQKDLRKKGDTADAWEAYSAEENAKLEKAYQKKQKTMKLSEKYKIDFNDMIQYQATDRNRQRAIKREEEGEEEEEEEESEEEVKPAKKKAKKKEAKIEKKTEVLPAKKSEKNVAPPKPKPLSKKALKAILKGKPLVNCDFYVPSGKVVVGTEHDIFGAPAGGADAPMLSGTVFVQPTLNSAGYTVRKGKWTIFYSQYLQACYHESVDAGFMNEDYLGELSQSVFDDFPNFWKGAPKACKDFRLTRKIGRYDWGMDGDPEKQCLFFHFVDKEKANIIEGHRILGEEFYGEAFGEDFENMTEVWSDKAGGGVCFGPGEEYRYGYFCTNRDASEGDEPTLFVVFGYEALPR
eukprot:Phypoly_transcript_11269.p1 GENE.Phypoly_transcript_11269~~Phypoly_transcript_11269.p1  ORF type:complete len:353 (+),score=96.10 Phypoly_transcript_11269:152-1210(+)